MDKSSSFNVVNFRRLEKINNYINIISVLLFLLALATIPVTYFSLNATRDGDVTVQVERVQYKQFALAATVGDLVWIGQGREPSIKEVPYIPVIAGLKTVDTKSNNNSFVTYMDTKHDFIGDRIKVSRGSVAPFVVLLVFYDEDFVPFSAFQDIPCPDKPTLIQSPTNTTYLFCAKKPQNDVVFYILSEDSNWYLSAALSLTLSNINFYSKEPSTVALCDSIFCAISYTVSFYTTIDEDTSATYSVTDLQTNGRLYNPFIQQFSERIGIIFLYNSIPLGLGNIFLPPTILTQRFVEQPKYSTSDTAIDSFAISGLIVSSILVAVTLAKFIVWIIFNPSR